MKMYVRIKRHNFAENWQALALIVHGLHGPFVASLLGGVLNNLRELNTHLKKEENNVIWFEFELFETGLTEF